MTDAARRVANQPLPAAISDAMKSAGLSPQIATLMEIIENFGRLQTEARAKAERVAELERAVEEAFPLKGLLPLGVSYRVGLDAAERGVLGAFKIGGRWFCTKREMARWLAATGRCR